MHSWGTDSSHLWANCSHLCASMTEKYNLVLYRNSEGNSSLWLKFSIPSIILELAHCIIKTADVLCPSAPLCDRAMRDDADLGLISCDVIFEKH